VELPDEESAGKNLDELRRASNAEAWSAACACLRAEAERGNADACFTLGVFYLGGLGVGKNPERAAFWVKKAALAGDEDAQYLLGNFAEQGVGMARNPRAALRWHGKAAERNFWFTWNDECFGEDFMEEKKRWMQRQSRKGNKFAQYELAWLQRNPARRAALLRRSAEQDDRSAQHGLGIAYCSGEGVKQDYAQAAYWLQRASVNPEISPHFENEPGLAPSDLAHLYREGKGVERDPGLAAHWYETSLHGGDCCAALALAMAYECGYGVEADLEKARHWYEEGGSLRIGSGELAAFFLELMDDAAGDIRSGAQGG
jgi:TPR repeat protein